MRHFDYIIVGGGIVGLSTAYALLKADSRCSLVLFEKEGRLAFHQTGRNSGVIHSGIYYKPGSLKATMAKTGNASIAAFCREHSIAHDLCGKVIVATSEDELLGFERLFERGLANGLVVNRLDQGGLREIEPHCAGIAALHVPSTGIVDYKAVCEKLAELVASMGGEIRLGVMVKSIQGSRIATNVGEFNCRWVVNCAGLYSDRVARASGAECGVKIVPFRGEYYKLRDERTCLVKTLIYPVPDPEFPFLGVHCTRMIDGSIHLGPNAVLALAREGYDWGVVKLHDLVDTLLFPGFWRLAAKHWRSGWQEMIRSLDRKEFVRSLQRLVPQITDADVVRCDAGVRAQALHANGALEDDFLIIRNENAVHVCNAPSPAATASLEIGEYVAKFVMGESLV